MYYRNYKIFDISSIIENLESTNLYFSLNDSDENYILLTDQFFKFVNQYGPLKAKTLRGN